MAGGVHFSISPQQKQKLRATLAKYPKVLLGIILRDLGIEAQKEMKENTVRGTTGLLRRSFRVKKITGEHYAVYNTQSYAKKVHEGGIPDPQAEYQDIKAWAIKKAKIKENVSTFAYFTTKQIREEGIKTPDKFYVRGVRHIQRDSVLRRVIKRAEPKVQQKIN